MAYVLRAEVEAKIPPALLVDALDDDHDGAEDAGVFDQIVATASNDVDARLAARFATPFANPAPSQVRAASLIFTLKAVYDRRPVGDKNPWKSAAEEWEKRLDSISRGDIQLDASIPVVVQAGQGSAPVVPGRIPKS